ncbi:MAG: copper resistance CopC/CopD family protein [bacterium]
MTRWFTIAALMTVLVLAGSSGAAAHGILKRSSPQAGTTVKAPPKVVTLVFSEPVDRVYSSATVVDAAGREAGGRASVSSDGRILTVPLKAGTGVFSVEWRVLSQLDGHTTTGRFRFAVRAAPAAGSTSAPAVEAPPPPTVSAAEQTSNEGEFDFPRAAIRWIGLAAALLTAGTAFFQWLVVRPLASHAEVDPILRPVYIGGAVVMAVSAIAEFLLQAGTLLDLPLASLLTSGMLAGMVMDTKPGWSALARVILAGIFLVPSTPRGRVFRLASVVWFGVVAVIFALLSNPSVATGSRHFAHLVALLLMATVYGLITAVGAIILPLVPNLKLPEGAWATPVAGLMAIGAITIGSHAAGLGPVAAIIDWCHLVASAAWIGGLVPLGLVLVRTSPSDRSDLARRIVPRFSQIAGWSLLILVVTGIYASWLHVPALRAFVATLYGRALLVKFLLVAPLVALGAVNHFIHRPRIEQGAGGETRRKFLRSVRAETILGAGVLLAVAVLTITPPASVSYSTAMRPPVMLAGMAGDMRLVLTVSQARDISRFFVELAGARVDADVQIVLTDLMSGRNPLVLTLASAGPGHFLSESAEVNGAGMWQIEVHVRSQDSRASVRFPFMVGPLPREQDRSAIRLLDRARSSLAESLTWRTTEQITDGSGNVVTTVFEGAPPDRLWYRTSSGVESIIIGSRRYLRQAGSAWQRDVLPAPLVISGPFASYVGPVAAAVLGRKQECGSETCQVVLWETVEPQASFAGWIGLRTGRIHRLLMVAPAHFMTAELRGVNIPIKINPP